jgi:hypothetical protein
MKICDKCRWVISTDNKCGCWPLARPIPMEESNATETDQSGVPEDRSTVATNVAVRASDRVPADVGDIRFADGQGERQDQAAIGEGVGRIWPSAELEKQMIADADLLASEFEPTSAGNDASCHIKALLCRIRELESSSKQLKDDLDSIRLANRVFVQDWPLLKANREQLKREVALLREEAAVREEQLNAAIDRSQSWKNLCEQFKDQSEGNRIGFEKYRGECVRLRMLLMEYAQHADDSGWSNLAEEIRRRTKEIATP